MLNRFFFLVLIFLHFSCTNIQNKKCFFQKINHNDVTIEWFNYSYITNSSPEYLTITKDNNTKMILESDDVITKVKIIGNTIVISLFKPERGIIYSKQILKEAFGYEIRYDTTKNYDDYVNKPKGIGFVSHKSY